MHLPQTSQHPDQPLPHLPRQEQLSERATDPARACARHRHRDPRSTTSAGKTPADDLGNREDPPGTAGSFPPTASFDRPTGSEQVNLLKEMNPSPVRVLGCLPEASTDPKRTQIRSIFTLNWPRSRVSGPPDLVSPDGAGLTSDAAPWALAPAAQRGCRCASQASGK